MQIAEGGCLCAAVRYSVTGSPSSSVICHCNTCRKASAAPSVAWLTFDRASFALLSGTPASYRSSAGVVRTFCGRCGSPLTYASDASPGSLDVTTVSLDDPDLFPPARELWLADKVSWEATQATLARYLRGSGEGAYHGT